MKFVKMFSITTVLAAGLLTALPATSGGRGYEHDYREDRFRALGYTAYRLNAQAERLYRSLGAPPNYRFHDLTGDAARLARAALRLGRKLERGAPPWKVRKAFQRVERNFRQLRRAMRYSRALDQKRHLRKKFFRISRTMNELRYAMRGAGPRYGSRGDRRHDRPRAWSFSG